MKYIFLLVLTLYSGNILARDRKEPRTYVSIIEINKMRKKFPTLSIYEVYDKIVQRKVRSFFKDVKKRIKAVQKMLKITNKKDRKK